MCVTEIERERVTEIERERGSQRLRERVTEIERERERESFKVKILNRSDRYQEIFFLYSGFTLFLIFIFI